MQTLDRQAQMRVTSAPREKTTKNATNHAVSMLVEGLGVDLETNLGLGLGN